MGRWNARMDWPAPDIVRRAPAMITKLIIQTHRTPEQVEKSGQSWRHHHPDFDYRFFDDEGCARLIRDAFPELWPAYQKLPLPVQRADLFRYAAVLHLGGVYADADTVCLAPIGSYVDLQRPDLVVGVEMTLADWHGPPAEYSYHYSVPSQWLQWTFAAPPRHVALAAVLRSIQFHVADHSLDELKRFSVNPKFTLALTGPMLFSQVLQGLAAEGRSGGLCILQRHVWGALPPEFKLPAVRRRMKVAHLFAGSWKPAKEAEAP